MKRKRYPDRLIALIWVVGFFLATWTAKSDVTDFVSVFCLGIVGGYYIGQWMGEEDD
jgi:hypothetical protein